MVMRATTLISLPYPVTLVGCVRIRSHRHRTGCIHNNRAGSQCTLHGGLRRVLRASASRLTSAFLTAVHWHYSLLARSTNSISNMAAAAETDAAFQLFLGVGLDETVARNTSVNTKLSDTLKTIIAEAKATPGTPKSKGNLLYYAATKYPANALQHRPTLLAFVMDERIKTIPQLDGAFAYLKKIANTPLSEAELNTAAGVGVVVTPEQIADKVSAAIRDVEAKLTEDRYTFNTGAILGKVTKDLKWADGATVKAEVDRQVEALLGPKTPADLQAIEDKKAGKLVKPQPAAAAPAPVAQAAAAPAPAAAAEPAPPEDPYAFFPKPNENNGVHTEVYFKDDRGVMRIANTPEQLKTHLEKTKGKVMTRFPPEPNGYLHIGHAKAMFIDFGMAVQYSGNCYLRYDDTNPAAEKLEYIEHIEEIVDWMGWKPWKITYSSDYFDQLYEYAVWMIKNNLAYVCHQTKAEIEACRDKKLPSPFRDRPIEESLDLFEKMRQGRFEEGEATLRLKMDYNNENVNMFDVVAYRIKHQAHPKAGDKWCIYPSYDYTHCIVDALEDITHSLCTLEFESRRASYYWLLEVLNLYKPVVWEYSRLNITNNVMSKRKLNKLVTEGRVRGWDDPRMLTLAGLRRRGANPAAINNFCREVGITRNENMININLLYHHIRADLDANAPRVLAVLRPLKLVIVNLPESHLEEVEAKVFPGRTEETYKVPFSRVVYIESTDFKDKDEKDFYGLAPGKSIMLRYAYPVTYKQHLTDASGAVTEVHVEVDLKPGDKKPPKGVVNWVAQPKPGQEPLKLEARLYNPLFSSEKPEESDDWLKDLNAESEQVIQGAYGCPRLANVAKGDKFQFERLGYFCVDPDSTPDRLVFNRTVTLKESFPKQAGTKEKTGNTKGGKGQTSSAAA